MSSSEAGPHGGLGKGLCSELQLGEEGGGGGGEGGKERDVVCRVTSLKGVRGEWGALRNPRKLGRLVAGISEGSPLPLTVKIRTGVSSGSINLPQVRPSPHPLATCPLGCLLCCDIAEFLR